MEVSQRPMDIIAHAYSFGGKLDLGWGGLQCVGHHAESMRLMQAACREIGVSLCPLTRGDRKIAHAVRSTCVYVRKLREATRMRFYRGFSPKDRKIGRTVSSFEILFQAAGS